MTSRLHKHQTSPVPLEVGTLALAGRFIELFGAAAESSSAERFCGVSCLSEAFCEGFALGFFLAAPLLFAFAFGSAGERLKAEGLVAGTSTACTIAEVNFGLTD